ncbi:DUF983 domain-containing protein [Alsobacter sp. SYSU M60028]|uniref:DUF983 domain-containing protein n=1 Tax=Alsobacter ponti TaxID=2962936 RepID=A0ABT1LFH9_9HYPH|nr:DUF983 domain-containing protein [Alsobacter ponti]MCP8939868.1 DUF983 domain-containing protein [Alsobacter ponti]
MLNDTRDPWVAIRRGVAGRCPHCGEGRLFTSYLKVTPRCEACGEHFHHHRADDLPAYIVIFVVGHIVVGGMLSAETHGDWPVWWHVVLWPLLTVVMSLGMLQPVKGIIVALQWANRMHGFGDGVEPGEPAALRPTERPPG